MTAGLRRHGEALRGSALRLADPEGAPEPARGGRAADTKAIRAVNAEASRPAPGGGVLAEALRRTAEKGWR